MRKQQQLMGVTELAHQLGTSRQWAWQITKRPDFPQPEAALAAGPVWDTAKVLAWLAQREENRK